MRAILLAVLALSPAGLCSAKENRLQLGEYTPEESVPGPVKPKVVKAVMSAGDLEVLIDQQAPCGPWVAVTPQWAVKGRHVTLDYHWIQAPPESFDSTKLCLKHVRAWVFGVPARRYTVTVSPRASSFERCSDNVYRSVCRER